MSEDDEHDREMERARWVVRLLAENQDTPQARSAAQRSAAQRHLERLGQMMKSEQRATRNSEG